MKKKNLLRYFFALLIFSTAFTSCRKKRGDNPSPQPVDNTSTTDVYAAGRINYIATYWKNGNPVSLTSGTNDALIRRIVVVKK